MSQPRTPLYDVGAAVRARREEAKLTQSKLAELAKLPDANAVRRIETGTGYSEMLERLEQVATAMGLSLQDLVFEARKTTLGHGLPASHPPLRPKGGEA